MNIGWKTKEGKLMKFSEMTQQHLENSIKYSERRKDYQSLKYLLEEQERREGVSQQNEFDKLIRGCPFCDEGMMKVEEFEYESDPEDGPGWGYKYSDFQLVCNKCEAEGPVIKSKGLKP